VDHTGEPPKGAIKGPEETASRPPSKRRGCGQRCKAQVPPRLHLVLPARKQLSVAIVQPDLSIAKAIMSGLAA
jgi:hypothetical protein